MIEILKIHIVIITMLLGYSVFGQNTKDLCQVVRVQTEIWSKGSLHDSAKEIRAELWSEYNDNVINGRNFPDTIWIVSNLMLPVDWMGQELPKDSSFFISVSMQLKSADFDDCIDVINPTLSGEILVYTRQISFSDIYIGMEKDDIFKLKSPPLPLKKYIRKYNIGLRADVDKKYLVQLIIKTNLSSDPQKRDCLIEHIHHVCASIPRDYIIGEW